MLSAIRWTSRFVRLRALRGLGLSDPGARISICGAGLGNWMLGLD